MTCGNTAALAAVDAVTARTTAARRRAHEAHHVHDERTCMPKTDAIEVEGSVTDTLPNAMFRVQLTNGHSVLAHLSGKMRRHRIRVMLEDRVVVELSPYDLTRGRLVYRHR